jgi:hypothetical protein
VVLFSLSGSFSLFLQCFVMSSSSVLSCIRAFRSTFAWEYPHVLLRRCMFVMCGVCTSDDM